MKGRPASYLTSLSPFKMFSSYHSWPSPPPSSPSSSPPSAPWCPCCVLWPYYAGGVERLAGKVVWWCGVVWCGGAGQGRTGQWDWEAAPPPPPPSDTEENSYQSQPDLSTSPVTLPSQALSSLVQPYREDDLLSLCGPANRHEDHLLTPILKCAPRPSLPLIL